MSETHPTDNLVRQFNRRMAEIQAGHEASERADPDNARLEALIRTVPIGPFGPNAKALINAGQTTFLTPHEADRLAEVLIEAGWTPEPIVKRVEALADEWKHRVSVLRGDGACGDVEADRLANVLQRHLDQLSAVIRPAATGADQ